MRERDKKINKQKKTVYQFNATRGTIVRVWANLKTQNNHSHTHTQRRRRSRSSGTCFGGANLTTTWTHTQNMCAGQQCVRQYVLARKQKANIKSTTKRIHTNKAKKRDKITANNKSHKQQTFILCMTNNRPEGIRGACTEREDKAVDVCQLSARNTK